MRAVGIAVPEEMAGSRLPWDATGLSSEVPRSAKGAVCGPAGVVPGSGRLMPTPVRVTPLQAGVVSILLPRHALGVVLVERFEQELQLGGVHRVEFKIVRKGWVTVAGENRLKSRKQGF